MSDNLDSHTSEIFDLDRHEVECVNGGAFPVLLLAFDKGALAGGGTAALGIAAYELVFK